MNLGAVSSDCKKDPFTKPLTPVHGNGVLVWMWVHPPVFVTTGYICDMDAH